MLTVLPNGWVFHEAESAAGFAKGIGAIKFDLNRRHSSLANVAWDPNGLVHSYDEYKQKFGRPVDGLPAAMAPPSMLEQVLHRNRVIVMVALLSVIGHNFRRILAWLSNLLRLILIALWRAFATSVAHNPAF